MMAVDSTLGPMVTTLGKMMKDVATFLLILAVFFVAFLVSLFNLYWYFDYETRKTFEVNVHVKAGEEYQSSPFGSYVPPNAAYLYIYRSPCVTHSIARTNETKD